MQIEMYKPDVLNLNEFIKFYELNMVLQNNILDIASYDYEILNYDELKAAAVDEIKDDLNYYESDLIDYYGYDPADPDTLPEAIEDYINDHQEEFITGEIYQWFIIPESEAEYWSKYTSETVFYWYEYNLYVLGVGHWGTSWSFFFTTAERPQYMRIEKYDKILNKAAGTSSS